MEILSDIPGFERGMLYCINGSKDIPRVFFAAKLIAELRSKYCISVAYFSTRGTSKRIENLQSDYDGLIGALYTEDLNDGDFYELCVKAEEMVEKKSVRLIVIDGIEGLDVKGFKGGIRAKREEIKTTLCWLAAGKQVRVLLFCPSRKSDKFADKELNPFLREMLPQMQDE